MAGDQNHQHSSIAEKLRGEGKPPFSVFEDRRRAGVPPPEIESSSDALAIPADIGDLSNLKLIPEGIQPGGSVMWLVTHIKCREDVARTRIPEWAGADEGATTCIFPRKVEQSWPKTEYKPIDRSQASCLRVTDVPGKGKGCVAAHTVSRGELVARERALLLMPRTFAALQQVAKDLASLMSPKQRASFFALYNCSKLAEPDDALGIIRTNAFRIPGMPGHNALYVAVFETFSRINHRCGSFSSFFETLS